MPVIQSSVSHDIIVARSEFDQATEAVHRWLDDLLRDLDAGIDAIEIHISHKTHTEPKAGSAADSVSTPSTIAATDPAPADPPA